MTDTLSSPETSAEMATAFEPRPVEARWYAFWQEQKYFQPGESRTGKHYSITIPPPNVTGVLHLGHAMQHTIHDCLIRYHRMKGDAALCVPGTDHASIATEVKVTNLIREAEGKSRHEIGRDEFLKRAYAWKDKYGRTIINQLKSLGCSYDWDRERFTMDEGYSRAVLTVFKDWYDKGLIYRGLRLVNWSPGAQSTVSDLEIDYLEVQGNLWHFRYPVEGTDEHIVVATTRPETMLGDTAVAVHPDDERYKHLHGQKVLLPLMNRAIPIVTDQYVDKEFGSGAVKITPAHDPNDYEIGQRHGLEMITVIGFDAKMTEAAGSYAGLTREEARKKVVADLDALGLLEKIEPYTNSVGHCSRTGTVIEPLLSEQWFVSMKDLARPVADAIKMGRVKYVPERYAATSLEWLENIRDWCISRQLWWGHRIPVYYGPHGEVKVSLEPITEEGWHQDEDVLDTWFSSALWPFAVLGWPDQFEPQWYPTNVLITGRDILNLWVSRMVLTSLNFVNDEIPFHEVYVHPTIQDCFGLRMSKSLGTGIDPMELIEAYGADATRFGLLQLATGTQDVRYIDQAEVLLGEETVRRYVKERKPLPLVWTSKPTERFPQMLQARNFANKIWNAARFVLTQGRDITPQSTFDVEKLDLSGRWILARLNRTIDVVTAAIEGYEFERAATELYAFIWGDFCDWFVELSKPKLRAGDANHFTLLVHVLETSMRLLHPFMPFLSEEIWQKLPKQEATASICIAAWPQSTSYGGNGEVERDFVLVQESIRTVRNLRAEAKLNPGQKVRVQLFTANTETASTLFTAENYLLQLANLEALEVFTSEAPRPQNALSASLSDVEIFLPLEGLIDVERERERLQKELATAQKDLERVTTKLSNPQFTDKAPEAVVKKEEAKRDELQAAVTKINERLQNL
jgi:valyl-tRNA synthetase